MVSSLTNRHWTVRWLLKFPPIRIFTELLYELGVNRIDALCKRMDLLEEGFKNLAENDSVLLQAAIRQQEQNDEILRRLGELEARAKGQAER